MLSRRHFYTVHTYPAIHNHLIVLPYTTVCIMDPLPNRPRRRDTNYGITTAALMDWREYRRSNESQNQGHARLLIYHLFWLDKSRVLEGRAMRISPYRAAWPAHVALFNYIYRHGERSLDEAD